MAARGATRVPKVGPVREKGIWEQFEFSCIDKYDGESPQVVAYSDKRPIDHWKKTLVDEILGLPKKDNDLTLVRGIMTTELLSMSRGRDQLDEIAKKIAVILRYEGLSDNLSERDRILTRGLDSLALNRKGDCKVLTRLGYWLLTRLGYDVDVVLFGTELALGGEGLQPSEIYHVALYVKDLSIYFDVSSLASGGDVGSLLDGVLDKYTIRVSTKRQIIQEE